jgi:DNA-binding LacI/PurR family transcriptional regulator
VLEAVRTRPDVAVVTFDGDSLLESVGRPVGVIYRQSAEIGRIGAGLLLERLAGRPAGQRTIPSLFRAPRILV